MERRSFLKGFLISASAAAGTALVQLATPEQAIALIQDHDVVLGQPNRYEPPWMGSEIYMKHTSGYVPVGYLTQLNMRTEMNDASSWWEGHGTLIPGIKHWTFEFEGRP